MTELEQQQAQHIKILEQKIDYLIRQLYGKSAETLDPSQLHLAFEEEFAKKLEAVSLPQNSDESEKEELAAKKKKINRKPRLPENIPTMEKVLIPDEVKANPDAYRQIGEKVSEQLDVEPTRFTLVRTIRPVFVRDGKIIRATQAPRLLDKSILSPSLLSHVITAKFCDHLPFYRQEQILKRRHGIEIKRSVLCNWSNVAAETLQALYKLLAQQLTQNPEINIDETPVSYLGGDSGSSQGYFWVYYHKDVGVLYDWQTSRGHTSLDAVLKSTSTPFKGTILCDGYNAYRTWSSKNDSNLAGCWAHVRRKFFESMEQHPDASKLLSYIQKLYHLENRGRTWLSKNQVDIESIKYWRRKYLRPIANKLYQQLKRIEHSHLPKSNLGKAIKYTQNQWGKLIRTLSTGSFELDNNVVENAVRPLKLGAKNWLFVGREDTGWRSAIIYTFIENIRRKGHDPYAYLKWVFERLPQMTNQHN